MAGAAGGGAVACGVGGWAVSWLILLLAVFALIAWALDWVDGWIDQQRPLVRGAVYVLLFAYILGGVVTVAMLL